MPGLNGKGPAGNRPGRRIGCCTNANTAEPETTFNLNRKGFSGNGRGRRNGRGKGFWRSESNQTPEETE